MEMPKNCDDCCLRQQNEGFVGYCGITKTLDVRSFEKDKLSNCPLVEVPTPHGRLIDADRLFKWIKAECNPYGAPTIGYEDGLKVLDMIDRCSTIIEAEEVDE